MRLGLRWSLLNTVIGRLGSFAAGIALARLLDPKDYGVFAVALVAMELLLSLNDVGVSSAIVRWEGDVSEVAATGMTLVLCASAVLYAGLFAVAPIVASGFGAPNATGVLRVLAFSVVIDGFFAVPSAMLTRDFRQRQRAISDLANFAVTSAVAVTLAVQGFGAYSLAWGWVAGNLAGGLLILPMTRTRFRPGFDAAMARRLISFGLPLTGSAFLTFAMLNLDYIVVGRVLGPVALGFYLLAFNLSGWPLGTVAFTVRRVSLAGFSRLQDDPPALRAALVRSLSLLMAVTLPICGLLGVLAIPLIRFLYGDRWAQAATVLPFLAVLSAVRVGSDFIYDYLVAVGRPRMTFVLQAIWVGALLPALVLGATMAGIRGAGMGHAVVAVAVVLPALLCALKATGVELRSLWRSMARSALGASLLLVAGYTASRVQGDLLALALGGTAASLVYVAVVWPHAPLALTRVVIGRMRASHGTS